MPESGTIDRSLFFTKSAARSAAGDELSEIVKPESLIVERVCLGETGAFDELYRMFAPLVHGIVLARVPFDDVDDIVQEVFMKAFEKISTLRDRNAVGAWLAMIARHSAVEFFRRKKPTEELAENVAGPDCPRAEASEILNVIKNLPDAYRETLVLRLVEGMTGPEIAEKTGLTHESVRVNLHRGMKLLRRKLGIEEISQ
jgi:RNA polymerase sigma-70 factor, ECF subfamily